MSTNSGSPSAPVDRLVRRAWEYAKWYHLLVTNPCTCKGDVREVMREITGFCEWMDSMLTDDKSSNMATMNVMRRTVEMKYNPAAVTMDVLSDIEDVLIGAIPNG